MNVLKGIWLSLWKIEQKGMTFNHFFLFILHFFFPLFLGGKRKGKEDNQSCGQKSCLSARSLWKDGKLCYMYRIKFLKNYELSFIGIFHCSPGCFIRFKKNPLCIVRTQGLHGADGCQTSRERSSNNRVFSITDLFTDQYQYL